METEAEMVPNSKNLAEMTSNELELSLHISELRLKNNLSELKKMESYQDVSHWLDNLEQTDLMNTDHSFNPDQQSNKI